MDPFTYLFRPKNVQQRFDIRTVCSIAGDKFFEGFRMGDIQTTFARQQKFTSQRWHGIVDIHFYALPADHFCGHQASRPTTDDCNRFLHKMIIKRKLLSGSGVCHGSNRYQRLRRYGGQSYRVVVDTASLLWAAFPARYARTAPAPNRAMFRMNGRLLSSPERFPAIQPNGEVIRMIPT